MPASLLPGARLGPYEITDAIGFGGMGEVYLARDTRLDRQVAIKVLSAAVADEPERLRRFVREAKTSSALNHPNIAHVYEIGEDAGRRFLVMEYIRGEGLDRRIGTRGIPPAEAIAIAIQIADALDEAHSHGIVHRDLKPANVMLTTRGRVKVLDFGLAKVLPTADTSNSAYSTAVAGSSAGLVLGTFEYMSPEQVRGLEVDHRSDIFSFGVLLYQMVTGRLPFTGTSRTDTVYRITQAQPEPLSRFSYDVPPDLERIMRKCLEKDPWRRYQSAHGLLVDLMHLRPDGSGVGLPVASAPPQASWRGMATALVAVLAGVAIGGVSTWWASRARADVIDSIAVVPYLRAGSPAEDTGQVAQALATALINNLSQLPNVRVAPRQLAFSAGGGPDDPVAIARQLGVHAVLLIEVRAGARPTVDLQLVDGEHSTALWGREYARSLGEVEDARETISDEVWNELRMRLNAEDRETLEVVQLYQRGRYLAARRKETDLRAAINLYDQALQRDRDNALVLAGKAEALNLLAVYGFERPQDAFPRAKASAEGALAIDNRLAEAHTTLAWVLFRWDWDFAGAGRAFASAMSLAPEYAQARHWAASFETAMGRFEDALARLREAQQIDPVSIAYRADVGWTLFMAQRYEESMRASLDAAQSAPGSFLPLRYLGMAHAALGSFDSAIEAYRNAIRLEGSNSVLLNAELAYVYARAGRTADAVRQLTELMARRDRNTYVSPYTLALTYAAVGDREQALGWLQTAYRERDNLLPWMKVDPRLDPLREDPRFSELVEKMRFD